MKEQSLQNKINIIFCNDYGYVLAVLVKQIKDIELAEDVLHDAITKAWSQWLKDGIPKNPRGWLIKTAFNKAIDHLRRIKTFKDKTTQITQLIESQNQFSRVDDAIIRDDRLELIFTCCHPAINENSQIALILNTVCGLSTEQVANAFILKTPTMAQRLVRAKKKIKQSGIPFSIPPSDEFPNRLSSVLSVIYLIYNQGYYAHQNQNQIDTSFTKEALYLAQTLNQLIPNQAELLGLLALINFQESRFNARKTNCNELITLKTQDRSLWDFHLIDAANKYFKQAIRLKNMGPLQIQAAISGVHSQANSWEDTDWKQIDALYQKLICYQPTITVEINSAVAMCYTGKVEAAWQVLQNLDKRKLENYLPYYLACAEVAQIRADKPTAINFFALAMTVSNSSEQQKFFQSQIDLLN